MQIYAIVLIASSAKNLNPSKCLLWYTFQQIDVYNCASCESHRMRFQDNKISQVLRLLNDTVSS